MKDECSSLVFLFNYVGSLIGQVDMLHVCRPHSCCSGKPVFLEVLEGAQPVALPTSL
jgi:hypothetical protein